MNLLNEFLNQLLVDLFSGYEFRNPFFDFLLLIVNDAMKMHFLFALECNFRNGFGYGLAPFRVFGLEVGGYRPRARPESRL